MCGIAAFLSSGNWKQTQDLAPISLSQKALAEGDWAAVDQALLDLAGRFELLSSFALHRAAATEPAVHAELLALSAALDRRIKQAQATSAEHGSTPELNATLEKLLDYHWQVEREVLAGLDAVALVAPAPLATLDRARHFVAFAVERVLASEDKLEVRGRDSLGLSVLVLLAGTEDPRAALTPELARLLEHHMAGEETDPVQGRLITLPDGRFAYRGLYKVANLVGRLGDNGTALRAAAKADALLWAFAGRADKVSVLAHTRWASNGLINVPNCHPVDGRVIGTLPGGADCVAVLNGDVDNYTNLVAHAVTAQGFHLHPSVSTDAKILPVLLGLEPTEASLTERFMAVMRRCHGSLAAVTQTMESPDQLVLSQKGSGQALYIGRTLDGCVVASEVYGLASVCRESLPLATRGQGGVAVLLQSTEAGITLTGHQLTGGGRFDPTPDPIQIFARDIYRGDFPYYIEKEINEAPQSIRKTLRGKYRRGDGKVEFLLSGFGNGEALRARLESRDRPPIRRILLVGQGTAAIAAMAAGYLIRQALLGTGIVVEASTASELFGFLGEDRFDDACVVAVSQSGTTTDTNRVVDLARSRGAWVHAIVNRRNSSLVQKSDSHLYTGDGRDVEMSVASTKAYYSQVAAGKLLALFLAESLGTLTPEALDEELAALEALPDAVERVLARAEEIFKVALETAPYTRNWALVGNGANRIAAEEIRIKLSELCYKAIPCDVTEDKKHIDLSTEPMTLVVANDLSEMVVQDTVKEVTIFRAHSGRPIVICAEGETRFDGAAVRTIPVPSVGGSLDFVLATVAGHLFGVAAAKAMDRTAEPFRQLRALLSRISDRPDTWSVPELNAAWDRALTLISSGITDAALPASLAGEVFRFGATLAALPEDTPLSPALFERAVALVQRATEELTRSIDTIRHQAKTVTVGISRPEREVSPLIQACFHALDVEPGELRESDRARLEALSPTLTEVHAGLLYEVLKSEPGELGPQWSIQAVRGYGDTDPARSRFAKANPATGSKRRALRTAAMALSPSRDGHAADNLFLPLFDRPGGRVARILLLMVTVLPHASLQQKAEVLKAFDERYQSLVEHLGELDPTLAPKSLIETLPLRSLLFLPAADAIDEYLTALGRA